MYTGVHGWQATSVGERQLGTRPIRERWAMSTHGEVIEQESGRHQACMRHISSTRAVGSRCEGAGNECEGTVSECEGAGGGRVANRAGHEGTGSEQGLGQGARVWVASGDRRVREHWQGAQGRGDQGSRKREQGWRATSARVRVVNRDGDGRKGTRARGPGARARGPGARARGPGARAWGPGARVRGWPRGASTRTAGNEGTVREGEGAGAGIERGRGRAHEGTGSEWEPDAKDVGNRQQL
ncbi:hypothetical protein DFH08DRAFT_825823 [Mycena albidolilacea]|uniref:Uncharacterized protein n=1 Tax=Mycena albidolilacea TaxID=1033008 RepID=A0AAD6Z186_9AGAR|nr:hypothetical protein DFH08DRAFT_825823 [Mycena albidolilacea]